MKWFEKAVGREKIIHLFDGDLDLNNVFLDTVLCYDYKLDLVFYLICQLISLKSGRKVHSMP